MCAYSLDHITPKSLRALLNHSLSEPYVLEINNKNTVRHIGIHKNESLPEKETHQIPIDGSFQIVKEQRKKTSCLLPEFILPDESGGAGRDRTDDPLLAKQVLSQLSYSPECLILVGLGRFELPTSPLSGVRSNQLSYRPRHLLRPRNL